MDATSLEPDRRAPRDGLSHVVGATEPPLSTLTVPALLDAAAARFPDRLAVVFRQQGVRWSWRELQQVVDRCAVGLHRLGLAKGERVGIWSPNRVEWLVTQFATARLGLILVNINPAYRAHRARVRAEPGRLQGDRHARRSSRPRTTSACCAAWRPSSTRPRPASCTARGCPSCVGDPHGRGADARAC